jgi:uncharacterized protein
MTLEERVMADLKTAVKAIDEPALRGLQAIKAGIIKFKTEPGKNGRMDAADELKVLQKILKQRQEILDIFISQNRHDLAAHEQAEIDVIKSYLP